ncbi:MAG: hypothetical protein ACJ0Q1_08810 [Luminiphilus sp.]
MSDSPHSLGVTVFSDIEIAFVTTELTDSAKRLSEDVKTHSVTAVAWCRRLGWLELGSQQLIPARHGSRPLARRGFGYD